MLTLESKNEVQNQLLNRLIWESVRFAIPDRIKFSNVLNQIIRYHKFLIIVVERYKRGRARFAEESDTFHEIRIEGQREYTSEEVKLFNKQLRSHVSLQLDIVSFYLLAKMLLDNVAYFIEFYFGQARGASLISHHKLIDNFPTYLADRGLSVPADLLDKAIKLQADVSDFRDNYLVHKPNPRRGTATVHGDRGQGARLLIHQLPATDTEGSLNVETKPLPDVLSEIDSYILSVIQLVMDNSGRTRLRAKLDDN